jgi:hypothetical protein
LKKIVAIIGACITALIVAVLALLLGSAFFQAQRADYGWSPRIATPSFTATHPVVLIDEGHHNASSAGLAGRYWPFARLLRADGYSVRRGMRDFTRAYLDGVEVLVIANASGTAKPQVFGMNIPIHTDGRKRSDPAFNSGEIQVVRSWVEQGGSLLLIADHAPFGEATAGLASAFGVTMHKGFTEVPGELSDPLLFSKQNGRLGGDHPILRGGRDGASISRVMTYTGQSLDGPPDAAVLLRLPPTAVEYVPDGDSLVTRPAGAAQGLAFEYGKGRVVVLGEAAMVTAQVNRRIRYGMNTPDNENKQFVINTMRWLAGML